MVRISWSERRRRAGLRATAWKLIRLQKRYDKALAAFKHPTDLDPADAEAWTGRADLLLRLERLEQALTTVERALVLDPELVDAWTMKAYVSRALGREQETAEAERKAAELDAIQKS